jgi:hypothetical protein
MPTIAEDQAKKEEEEKLKESKVVLLLDLSKIVL